MPHTTRDDFGTHTTKSEYKYDLRAEVKRLKDELAEYLHPEIGERASLMEQVDELRTENERLKEKLRVFRLDMIGRVEHEDNCPWYNTGIVLRPTRGQQPIAADCNCGLWDAMEAADKESE